MPCRVLQGQSQQVKRNKEVNTMKQDNKQLLCAIHSDSLRGLIDIVNDINSEEMVITKENIVDILNHHDNFFLLYFK